MKRAAFELPLLLLNTVALFAAAPEADEAGGALEVDCTASLSLILRAQYALADEASFAHTAFVKG
jgi:hypothetical protein